MEKEHLINPKKNLHHNRNKVLVNLITSIRTLGTFAIIPLFLFFGYLGVGICSIIIFLTDCIDGKLARKLHVESFFGALLDGLSDKVFGLVCLTLLSLNNPLFLLSIVSEVLILGINFISIKKGNNVKASYLGKVKIWLLGASIVGSFLCFSAPNLKEIFYFFNTEAIYNICLEKSREITSVLAISTFIPSVATAIDYLKKASKGHKEENKNSMNEEKKRLKNRKELIRDLISTEFYLEHKDDGILKLLYTKKE